MSKIELIGPMNSMNRPMLAGSHVRGFCEILLVHVGRTGCAIWEMS